MTITAPPLPQATTGGETSLVAASLAAILDAADTEFEAHLRSEILDRHLTPPEAKAVLTRSVPVYGAKWEGMAAASGAAAYDVLRADAGASAVLPYTAVLAPPASRERWLSLIGWGLTKAYEHRDMIAAATDLTVGLGKTVADAHRNTIIQNAMGDPASRGWYREAEPEACAFCEMLAQRGKVYKRGTVDFKVHDRCRCTAHMKWAPLDGLQDFKRSTRVEAMSRLDAEYLALSAMDPAVLTSEQRARMDRLGRAGGTRVRRLRDAGNEYAAFVAANG